MRDGMLGVEQRSKATEQSSSLLRPKMVLRGQGGNSSQQRRARRGQRPCFFSVRVWWAGPGSLKSSLLSTQSSRAQLTWFLVSRKSGTGSRHEGLGTQISSSGLPRASRCSLWLHQGAAPCVKDNFIPTTLAQKPGRTAHRR